MLPCGKETNPCKSYISAKSNTIGYQVALVQHMRIRSKTGIHSPELFPASGGLSVKGV